MDEHSPDGAPTPYVEIVDKFAMIPEALLYDPAVPADAVRVYGVLLRYGSDPTNCYPSHATIARHIGKAPRSVPAWILALEVAGWVDRVHRKSPEGDWTSNGYRIHGRAQERGVRADERVPVRASERVPSALERAPKESQGNDSQGERERELPALVVADWFDRFWDAYPAKVGKGQARRAWPRAVKAAGSFEVLIEGAERYAADRHRDPRFTAHPATWLNGERWLDQPIADTPRLKNSTTTALAYAERHAHEITDRKALP